MKPNYINKLSIKHFNSMQRQGEQSMVSEIKYDDFMSDIVKIIKTNDIDTVTEYIMTLIKTGELEQVSGNLYKYKDFHILELLEKNGMDYSNKLKVLDKLNLNITQKYIDTINKDGTVYIITNIPGTEKGNLIPLWKFGIKNISKEDRLAAFKDFQKLTKAGLTDDKISRSNEMWYVNPENKIIIPVFEHLRKITPNDNQKEILEKYYNILFK